MDDGLRLAACAITNAVRCVPPLNKPTSSEIKSCRPFLAATIAALPDLCAIVALGRIAHRVGRSCLRPEASRVSIRAWRRTSLGRGRNGPASLSRGRRDDFARRQLSLLPLQHQYRRADARHVPSRFRQGPRKTLRFISRRSEWAETSPSGGDLWQPLSTDSEPKGSSQEAGSCRRSWRSIFLNGAAVGSRSLAIATVA